MAGFFSGQTGVHRSPGLREPTWMVVLVKCLSVLQLRGLMGSHLTSPIGLFNWPVSFQRLPMSYWPLAVIWNFALIHLEAFRRYFCQGDHIVGAEVVTARGLDYYTSSVILVSGAFQRHHCQHDHIVGTEMVTAKGFDTFVVVLVLPCLMTLSLVEVHSNKIRYS